MNMTYWEIAQKYSVPALFGVKKRNSCEVIVHRALAGCPYTFTTRHGRLRLEPYEGLIPSQELAQLSRQHMKLNGERHRDQGTGIFGLSARQRRKNAQKAGKAGGAKGARQAHLNRGNVLWENVEIAAYALMTRDPSYHAQGDINKRLDRAKIAAVGNEVFHQGKSVRTPDAIGTMLYRERAYVKQVLSCLEEEFA